MSAGAPYRVWVMTGAYFLLGFMLGACTQQVDIHFYDNERWEVKSQLEYDTALLDNLVSLVFEALETVLPVEISEGGNDDVLMDKVLNALVAYYSNQGIDAQWRKGVARGGQRRYRLDLSGQSYATFERLLAPGMISLTSKGDNKYHLEIYLGDFNALAGMLYQQSITVHAGEIYNSNAPRQRGNTAAWQNPNAIDVVFSPAHASVSSLLVILLVGGALLLTFGAVRRLGKRRCWNCGARVPKKAEFCAECGNDLRPLY